MTIVLSIVAGGAIPGTLHAQSSSLLVPDSVMTTQSTARTGLNLPGMSYGFSHAGNGSMNNGGITNTNNNFLKDFGSYKLNLSNGLSLKTESFGSVGSSVSALNPNNFRRENFLPREELLYGQRFSLGASYNGLNNMLRGGAGGMNGRNPGLSLHAGISF